MNFRRFKLVRKVDVSGVSGTGNVAEGIQFSNGEIILHWLTTTSSIAIYRSLVEMSYIHSHGDSTSIEWIDDEDGISINEDLKTKVSIEFKKENINTNENNKKIGELLQKENKIII